MFKKSALLFICNLLVSAYTTFVLTFLWDWFVTAAFHVSEISFFVMFGLVLLVSLFRGEDPNTVEDQRWKSLLIMLGACVPDEKKEKVKEELQDFEPDIWLEAGLTLFGRAVTNTLVFGVAFVVHLLA